MIDNFTELDNIAKEILNNLLKEQTNKWLVDSKYKDVRKLQIDKRGSFGERFLSQVLFNLYPRYLEYNDGNQGDWDIKIKNIKIEIKTSTLDSNNKFQNENIKENGDYHGIIFLGITPNQLKIKMIKKCDIDFNKLHNRRKRNTGANYKWDFKKEEMIAVYTKQDIKNYF